MADLRHPSKRAQLKKVLSRKTGAPNASIQNRLNSQPHTIRAEISRLRTQGLVVIYVPAPKGPVYRCQGTEQS